MPVDVALLPQVQPVPDERPRAHREDLRISLEYKA
jgi:hypothetical protein